MAEGQQSLQEDMIDCRKGRDEYRQGADEITSPL